MADGNSLGPIGEVHLKFQVGRFYDIFVILTCNKTLFLVYHGNVTTELAAHGIERVSISLPLKNKFLALSINPQLPKQLVKTKGQCRLQGRLITWISIKMPRNIEVNNLLEVHLDRQLPKGVIPLDVLHNIEHKQPQEMLIPLLNVMNSVVKLPKILF